MINSSILKSLTVTAIFCASTNVSAQDANELLNAIQMTPESADAVTAMCNARLQVAALQKTDLENMPVSTDPAALFAAYDDLSYVLISTAYAEPLLLQQVHDDADIRKAGAECQARAADAVTDLYQSTLIFERLNAIKSANKNPEMDWTLSQLLENFRRGGVGRDDATRAEIGLLLKEITVTGIEFQQNLAKDTRSLIVDANDIAGLPDDFVSQFKLESDNTLTIPVTGATLSPILRYAQDDELRKRMMVEFESRAYPENDVVLTRLISLRDKLAKLMAYENFAAFDFANRMAKDPETVQAFMDDSALAARPLGDQEIQLMLERLRQDDPSLTELNQWSTSRALGLIRTEEYGTDPKVIRQYFHYDKVRTGIFGLTEGLFGVSIQPWNTSLWSDEAESYEIVENGRVIGRFYLDMHPRDGKFTHAAMFPVRVGIEGRAIPIAALVTNFPNGLMEHSQVETFLHEFGHLLHWVFAGKVKYATQNFLNLESDVTEAPSTLLEEWVWDYDTLKNFATNSAGEVIPEELVKKMNAGRNFGKAFATLRDLSYAAISFDFYSKPMDGMNLSTVENSAVARYYPLKPLPGAGATTYTTFDHLTDYGASYYTYQWSQALATDLMSRFRSAGLRDKATAKDYREMILAPGGSASMNDLAREFLGRDWSVDSYRDELNRGTRD